MGRRDNPARGAGGRCKRNRECVHEALEKIPDGMLATGLGRVVGHSGASFFSLDTTGRGWPRYLPPRTDSSSTRYVRYWRLHAKVKRGFRSRKPMRSASLIGTYSGCKRCCLQGCCRRPMLRSRRAALSNAGWTSRNSGWLCRCRTSTRTPRPRPVVLRTPSLQRGLQQQAIEHFVELSLPYQPFVRRSRFICLAYRFVIHVSTL